MGVFQTCTVLSWLAEAMRRESGDHASVCTVPMGRPLAAEPEVMWPG